MQKAVILTAISVEYLAVRHHLLNCKEEVHSKGTIYERGQFEGWEVLLTETGVGNDAASVEAERAIQAFSPQVLMFVGVAGGIKDVKIGDVVAATKVYAYESGKAEDSFKPRPDLDWPSYRLQKRAQFEAKRPDWLNRLPAPPSTPDLTPVATVAPIAAGSKVVASTKSATFRFLRKQYGDAVAVEMEGSGCLTAVRANDEVQAIIIRGISDLIDGKVSADASGSQKLAAQNAAAFAFELLSKLSGSASAANP